MVFFLMCISFLAGVAVTVAVAIAAVLYLVRFPTPGYHGRVYNEQYSRSRVPEELLEQLKKKDNSEMTSLALNSLFMFYFQEMKNSTTLRAWAHTKILAEIADMQRKVRPLRAVVRELSLQSFDLGTSLPLLKVIDVHHNMDESGKLQTVDVIFDIEYNGGFVMVLGVLLKFDTDLLVTCRLNSLSGRGRLRFSRVAYTNWSFAFTEEPNLKLDLQSNFNGRNIPRIIIPVLINQIKRSIRKKHTLPNYRMRLRPLFYNCTFGNDNALSANASPVKQAPVVMTSNEGHDGVSQRRVKLWVTVVCCSRLVIDKENSKALYCILTLGSDKYNPNPRQRTEEIDVQLSCVSNQTVGIAIGQLASQLTQGSTKKEPIVVVSVASGSVAHEAGVRKGDVVVSVDGEEPVNARALRTFLAIKSARRIQLRLLRNVSHSNHPKIMRSHTQSLSEPNLRKTDVDGLYTDVTLNRDTNKSLHGAHMESIPYSSPSHKSSSELPFTSSFTSESLLKISHRRTSPVTSCTAPSINERFLLQLEEDHLYVNVCIFSINKLTQHDSLVGFASISLHDAMAQCDMTFQGDTQLTVNLQQAPDLPCTAPPGVHTFEKSRCFGDVTLRFVKHGIAGETIHDEVGCVTDPADGFVDVDVQPDLLLKRDLKNKHRLLITEFESSVICDFCSKKIWFKKAMQCSVCKLVCHKKCGVQCQNLILCQNGKFAWIDGHVAGNADSKAVLTVSPTLITREEAAALSKASSTANYYLKSADGSASMKPSPSINSLLKSPSDGVVPTSLLHPSAVGALPFSDSTFTSQTDGLDTAARTGNTQMITSDDNSPSNGTPSLTSSPVIGSNDNLTRLTANTLKNLPEDGVSYSRQSSVAAVAGTKTLQGTAFVRASSTASSLMQRIRNKKPIGAVKNFVSIMRNRRADHADRKSPQAPTKSSIGASVSADFDRLEVASSSSDSEYELKMPNFGEDKTDEQIITEAKELGKQLFASLDVKERKESFNAMISKMEQEIELVSAVREDLSRSIHTTSDPGVRRSLENQLRKAEEKMQALAVLLLEHCAGLQHCVELENRAAASATAAVPNAAESSDCQPSTSEGIACEDVIATPSPD